MIHKKHILPNGLRLLTIPMPSFESVTVLVMVGAGSRYETKKNNGISHFLEHMPFKGTVSRPSSMEVAQVLDGVGAEWNAFTGKETTGYYIKLAKSHLNLAFDLLSDLLQHPLFDQKEIDKEKGVIIEEINMYEDTPMQHIGDIYEMLLYGDTPLGWDTAGTKQVIRKVTRKDFLSYMGKLYSADNMSVIVAGGFSEKESGELTEKYFGSMKKFPTPQPLPAADGQKKPALLVQNKKTEQTHLALGFRTAPLEHPDRYALDVLATILGGGTSSRLFTEIRSKRGLAYYVRASSDNYTDCGTLVVTAGVDPKKLDDAVRVILEEFKKVKEHGVTEEEVRRAKELMKGHLVLELEDSRSVASFYAYQELLESKVLDPKDMLEHIEKVTQEDILRVAKTYIVNETLNLAVIGNTPRQKLKDLLRLK